jgi:hypothetical protein
MRTRRPRTSPQRLEPVRRARTPIERTGHGFGEGQDQGGAKPRRTGRASPAAASGRMRSACSWESSPTTLAICYVVWPAVGHPELVAHEPPATALQDRRTPHPACPVLHPAACRESLDPPAVSADPRVHRATAVASDVIESPTWGAEATRGTGRSGGDVSKQRRRLDQTLKREAAGRFHASRA